MCVLTQQNNNESKKSPKQDAGEGPGSTEDTRGGQNPKREAEFYSHFYLIFSSLKLLFFKIEILMISGVSGISQFPYMYRYSSN